jgi:peptide/nickel transport system ATP-binding protein
VSPRVQVQKLVKDFPAGRRGLVLRAVNDVTLDIQERSTVAVVGESGSGKTTLGRCLVRLVEPTAGAVLYDGRNIFDLSAKTLRAWRRRIQIVFQDPYDALNPRMSVGKLLEEPLRLHARLTAAQRQAKIAGALRMVRLDERLAGRYPRELSGGQLQRVGIARALILDPEFVVLDEPTSSVDLSIRGEILQLLDSLKRDLDLTYVLISHDLATVEGHSDFVAVMYLGRIVEFGPTESVFSAPQHPYTQALLAATLPADPEWPVDPITLAGEQPSPIDLPQGCAFASRCPLVTEACRLKTPEPHHVGAQHYAHCIRIEDGSNQVMARQDREVVMGRGSAFSEGAAIEIDRELQT